MTDSTNSLFISLISMVYVFVPVFLGIGVIAIFTVGLQAAYRRWLRYWDDMDCMFFGC